MDLVRPPCAVTNAPLFPVFIISPLRFKSFLLIPHGWYLVEEDKEKQEYRKQQSYKKFTLHCVNILRLC